MDVYTALLTLSLVANAGFGLHLWKLKKTPPENQATYDAKLVLRDLLHKQGTLVRVMRVDPEDVLLRSPRGRD